MAQGTLSADQLRQVLSDTLSPYAETRINAERQLEAAQRTAGHPLEVLRLVASLDMTAGPVRLAAAVHLKNVVKHGWDPDREGGTNGIIITAGDRTTIKSHLVQLMCTVPPQIRAQFSETISLIAAVDYPQAWENLLPELVQQFNSADPAVVCGVLQTANSIFKRFRYVDRNDELYKVIIYTLNIIQAPLLTLTKTIGQAVDALSTNAAELRPRFDALRSICRIFFSLNYQDLPEFFEDHMQDWMTEFAKYLLYRNPVLEDESEESQPSPIDRLQAAIIENLSLYADKDEETFIPFLPNFTTLVWNLLMEATALPKHDTLATTSIKFLSSLIEKLMHKHLFQDEATLRQIVARIVIPNIMIREIDQENFEDNPREFILTEMEGSDNESRRRCSQILLRSMCRHFEAQTAAICLEHIGTMLAEFNADPANKWISKDAAIQLLLGIAIRRESRQEGVSEVNEDVNINEFFNNYVLPELHDGNHDRRPMIKASALKFVSTFRNQFSKEQSVALLPLLISYLSSRSVVVHTFAAYSIERMLVTRDAAFGGQRMKVGRQDIQPLLQPLFSGLFSIIDREDLNENDWVIKCVMRALSVSNEDLIPVMNIVLNKLTGAISRIATNPRNPEYNHYVFESIAVLIRALCSRDPALTSSFEELLFPPFQDVLQKDVLELSPYVFQILAQLLEYRPREAGLGEAYTQLFKPLLTPALWERSGNVPALTRLIHAYLSKDAPSLVAGGYLTGILGVFQKLLSVGRFSDAFEILDAIITYVTPQALEQYIGVVFQLVINCLAGITPDQRQKSKRFVKPLSQFFALYIGKYGSDIFLKRLDNVSQGKSLQVVKEVWVPVVLQDPPRRMDAKIQVIGLSKLLSETPVLLADDFGRQVWANVLASLVTLFTNPSITIGSTELDDTVVDVQIGYDAQYSKLSFARQPVDDPFPDIDPLNAFLQGLHMLSMNNPGVLGPLVQASLQSDLKLSAGLEAMLKTAGLSLS